MNDDARRHVKAQVTDVAISVAVVTAMSMLGLVAGYVMGASHEQREWSMLYAIASIGSFSSFFCLIKLARFSRLMGSGPFEVTKKDQTG